MYLVELLGQVKQTTNEIKISPQYANELAHAQSILRKGPNSFGRTFDDDGDSEMTPYEEERAEYEY